MLYVIHSVYTLIHIVLVIYLLYYIYIIILYIMNIIAYEDLPVLFPGLFSSTHFHKEIFK